MNNDLNPNAEYATFIVPAAKLAHAALFWKGLEVLVDGNWMTVGDPDLTIHTEGVERTRYGYKKRERVALTKTHGGPFHVRVNLKANPAVRAYIALIR
jgi:hypothetical protein